MDVLEFYDLIKGYSKITIDSRTVEKDDVFFAFSGENFNAARIASQAVAKGAKAVIIEDQEYQDPSNQIFYVPSTLKFLQDLARVHRETLNIPIIGMTGSNGKTTSKELLSQVLAARYKVQYTIGNLNNHIGVPLTLLSIKADHEIAVVEMGANHKKEIEFLAELSRPTIGYITNFGKAHLEGFGGFAGVVEGKSELYTYIKESGGLLLVNSDDPIQVEKSAGYSHTICFGSDKLPYRYDKLVRNQRIGLTYQGKEILSKLTGDYNFSNISAAVTLGLYFDLNFDQIKEAIENYVPSNMRSQIVKRGNQDLILDTYNANPTSMKVALENFNLFEGSKTAILGDMLELGEESLLEHRDLFELVNTMEFENVYTVGPEFLKVNPNGFATTDSLIQWLSNHRIKSKTILLKGSRGIALEKLIPYL